MSFRDRTLFFTLFIAALSAPLNAQQSTPSQSPIDVEKLTRQSRPALVAITVEGRDGKQQGMGTGFVVSKDGLIATNLHVIGEARPIQVQFPDGKKHDVSSVHAWDRALDLAVVKIEGKDLPALELGEAKPLAQGQPIVMLGNPHGLRYSVVSGVVSGTQEIGQRQMIQVAAPVEPGNSGGPVIDAAGRVVGVITMKSLVTDNLGFAAQVEDLKALLEKPNPVPIARWLTIGTLDAKKWSTLFGARWQQRAGKIIVSGSGDGFGGRSLCLANEAAPEIPFEIGVSVRLGDEAGAAGLVFHSDGADRHYGFYPSAGKLRLARFEGPDVFSWQVLREVPSEHYRRGEWNDLKVRVEKDKILCFVNDELVIESTDREFAAGKFGLAKFRDTQAEFKSFRTAQALPKKRIDDALAKAWAERLATLPPLAEATDKQLADLAESPAASVKLLRGSAAELTRRAKELELLAADVHVAGIAGELAEEMKRPDAEIDLLRAALLIARLDDDEAEIEPYLEQVDSMAAEIRASLAKDANEAARLAALNKFLFEQNGFHGSRTDYYHRANSYLSRVIDDREGLPITLSVLYIELGRRLDLKIVGVGLPAHFVVRHEPAAGEPQLIDVFEGGKPLTRDDADKLVRELTGEPLAEEFLTAQTKQQIVRRILQNLLGIAQRDESRESMLRYVEAAVALDEADLQSRGLRAILRHQTGRLAAALTDLDWFLKTKPEGIDLDQIRAMREQFATGTP